MATAARPSRFAGSGATPCSSFMSSSKQVQSSARLSDQRSAIITSSTGSRCTGPNRPIGNPIGMTAWARTRSGSPSTASSSSRYASRVCRRGRAELEGACREEEVLHGRPDRARVATGVLLDVVHDAARDDDHRGLVHVLGLPQHGVPHSSTGTAGSVALDRRVLEARLPVQLADAAALHGVADDDPPGALQVASRRRAVRCFDQAANRVVGHRVGPQPAHRATRRHHCEHVVEPVVTGQVGGWFGHGQTSARHEETSDVCALLSHG